MSEGPKMPLQEAVTLAQELRAVIAPSCHRTLIVGSIRRRRPEVGDIELCAVMRDRAIYELQQVLRMYDKIRGHISGRYTRINLGPCAADLYWCTPETWGLNVCLRTGSKDFAHGLAARSKQMGYEFHQARVRLRDQPGTEIDTPEEGDVFNLLELAQIPPEQRETFEDVWSAHALWKSFCSPVF